MEKDPQEEVASASVKWRMTKSEPAFAEDRHSAASDEGSLNPQIGGETQHHVF